MDDSANKRLSVQQAFLAADAMLILAENVSSGLVVYPKVIERRLREELPFMATENIIMAGVKKGGDRQALHEAIRVHSHAAAHVVKAEGGENDLLERMAGDPEIGMTREEIEQILDMKQFVGRAPEQVVEFVAEAVDPILERHSGGGVVTSDVRV